MLKTYRKLYALLDRRERIHALMVFIFSIIVAVAEVIGVASILPFMAAVSDPSTIQSNRTLSFVRDLLPESLNVSTFLTILGFGVIILLISSLIIRAIGLWIQVRYASLRSHSISYRLMRAYLYQPYSWFLNQHTSRMTTTVLSEAARVVNGALLPAMQVVTKSLIVGSLLLLLILADPLLAVTSIAIISSAYVVIYILSRKILSELGEKTRLKNQQRFRVAQEVFGGIKDLFIIGREHSALERFRIASEQMALYSARGRVTQEIPPMAMQALIFAGMISIVLYLLGVHGNLQSALPMLTLFALAGYRLMPEMQGIYRNVAQIRMSGPILNAIYEDLHKLEATTRPPATIEGLKWKTQVQPTIQLEDICYSYPGSEELALSNVSLSIPAYSTIGVVGPTGSGKTTLVDIILGLLSSDSGVLAVDGNIIRRENVREWQSMIGYVPQQIFLTDDTVAGNIAFGVEEKHINKEAVELAAKIANLHEFILGELPEGYQTRIGEKGVRLSGGQRQRIGIARALYYDPSVLILDEATSALDNLTEKAVMDAVNNLSAKKTIILIAHRLTTVKTCDKILLLEKGKVSAIGSYDELIHTNETFRKMVGETS